MQKTYYIQSLKKFYKELATLNDNLCDNDCALVAAITNLLSALGFVKQEDGTFKAPKIHSIWGIRAYSKRFIAYQDIEKYIAAHDLDIDLNDFSEEEIEKLLDCIAEVPCYSEHVHQPEYVIQSAVETLQEYSQKNLIENEDEDEDKDEDEDDKEDEDDNMAELNAVISALEKASNSLKSLKDLLEN